MTTSWNLTSEQGMSHQRLREVSRVSERANARQSANNQWAFCHLSGKKAQATMTSQADYI